MFETEQIITAQQSRMQTAGSSRTSTPGVDTRGGSRIGAEVVARPWPAVLEDPAALLPLGWQDGADRVGNQVIAMGSEIQAGQGAAHLGLRAEQCRGHAITPRASSTSANAASTVSSWSASRTGTVMLS